MCPLPELGDRCAGFRGRLLRQESPCESERRQRLRWQWCRLGLFRKFFAARIDRDRVVQVDRRREPELLLEPDLPRCRRQQVGAAYDMGYRLFRIVDYHGELIREQTIGTPDHEVAHVALQVLLLRTLQPVDEACGPVIDIEPPRVRRSSGGDAIATGARIDALADRAEWRKLKLLARARAAKRQSSFAKVVER